MTSTLVQGAAGIFTGLPGEAMRATGAIRIVRVVLPPSVRSNASRASR